MWHSILNHEPIVDRFRQSFVRDRLANTYLFVGPHGIGKRTFALKLAEVLLCENRPADFESCGTCAACHQVQAESHPDLILVSKPDDKNVIPVEFFIGDKEHRRQEGLIHDIGLKPFRGGRKIAIVDDADYFNQEGANSLLKTLEEPPPNSLLILIGSSEQQQLSTILSRSQVIRFNPLTNEQVLSLLQQNVDLETPIDLEQLAAASNGSIELASLLANPDTFNFRQQLLQQLATCDPGQNEFGKTVIGFVDGEGKEGVKRRHQLMLVADLAIPFFQECYRQLTQTGQLDAGSTGLSEPVSVALAHWKKFDALDAAELAGHAIDRCLEMQQQTRANANPANVVEAWLIDLGRICRGQASAQLLLNQ